MPTEAMPPGDWPPRSRRQEGIAGAPHFSRESRKLSKSIVRLLLANPTGRGGILLSGCGIRCLPGGHRTLPRPWSQPPGALGFLLRKPDHHHPRPHVERRLGHQ